MVDQTRWLSSALSCPFIVQQDQPNERSWNSRFLFSPTREIYWDSLYIRTIIHVFSSCLLLVVYLKGVRCICVVCIVYALPLVVFNIFHTRGLCFCSLCLLSFTWRSFANVSRNNIVRNMKSMHMDNTGKVFLLNFNCSPWFFIIKIKFFTFFFLNFVTVY